MKVWFALFVEGLKWLRRDKVFIPAMIGGLGVTIFANVASGWTIEEFKKMLFDVGLAGFRVTGGTVAIMWGSRMIHDALNERSIETRLAAPINRSTWLLARFCALAVCLMLIGIVFAVWWQCFMALNGYGVMNNIQSWAMALLVCEWLVLGALAMTMATLGGFAMALFSTASLWLAGLLAPMIASTTDNLTPQSTGAFLDFVADVWNFQRFNLVDAVDKAGGTVDLSDLSTRLGWAGAVLIALLTFACWRFESRDLG